MLALSESIVPKFSPNHIAENMQPKLISNATSSQAYIVRRLVSVLRFGVASGNDLGGTIGERRI